MSYLPRKDGLQTVHIALIKKHAGCQTNEELLKVLNKYSAHQLLRFLRNKGAKSVHANNGSYANGRDRQKRRKSIGRTCKSKK